MCGIAGILSEHMSPEERTDQVKRMIAALTHRGPDGWGYFTSSDITLGHTRLAIVDLNSGDQPITDGRYVIVYNGEVYNHPELREELLGKGAHFYTRSDTEVVLKAFEHWGKDAFTKFNGQFALLIWDRKEKRLTAARDRYGVRPLYILEYNRGWYYASELKAFDLIPGFNRSYDMLRLCEHGLLWNTIGDGTVWRNIRCLASGTIETFSAGSIPVRTRYYSLGETLFNSAQPIPETMNEAIDEFSAMLTDSVLLRLRSDVPVGAYLSGGIDSSVITYLAHCLNRERFKTFSVVFEDKDYDERTFQDDMVAAIGSDHTTVKIDYDSISDNLLDAVYHIERPVFRTAPVPLFLLARRVRESGIKVVLTGEAADEVLWGYDSYKELKLLRFWNRNRASLFRPHLLRALYPHLRHYADSKQFGLIKMYYEEFLSDYDNDLAGLNIRVNNNKSLVNFFNRDAGLVFDKNGLIERLREILPPDYKKWSLLQKNQYLEMYTLLSGYLLSSQGDRMSLAHGVEGRYPFLDHRLVERVFAYPDKFKLAGFSQKHILRRAFADRIPSSIVKRNKQPYQAPDLKSFFRSGALNETASTFLSPESIEKYGVFDKRQVERFLKKFERGQTEIIGYRDNMTIIFLLSAHMALYWAKNPKIGQVHDSSCTVAIIEP